MRIVFLCGVLFLVLGCSQPQRAQIIVPQLHAGFYADALAQIDQSLKREPSNVKLLQQKVYYCEQLGWPTNCLSALDQTRATFGMSNQLVEQYIQYYITHDRFAPLVDLIERWNTEYGLIEDYHQAYIQGLVVTGQPLRARVELRRFLANRASPDDFVFAADQYLRVRDTLMSAYYLGKVHAIDQQHALMFDYGKMLVNLGYVSKGYAVIDSYKSGLTDDVLTLQVASFYAAAREWQKARSSLRPVVDTEPMAYLMVDWYKEETLWDSALMYIDPILARDSLSQRAWWEKASVYEERGWLSYCLPFFEKARELAPNDSTVIKRIDAIQRKLAYLQRKKFEESKVPLLDLKTKKNIINE